MSAGVQRSLTDNSGIIPFVFLVSIKLDKCLTHKFKTFDILFSHFLPCNIENEN